MSLSIKKLFFAGEELAPSTVEIDLGESPLSDWLAKNNFSGEDLLQVVAPEKKTATWENMCVMGIVTPEGKCFDPVGAGAGHSRKGESFWANREIYNQFERWHLNGLEWTDFDGNLNVNKGAGYLFLVHSSAKPVAEYNFGHGEWPAEITAIFRKPFMSLRKWAIAPSIIWSKSTIMDKLDPKVIGKILREMGIDPQKIDDGITLVIIDDESCSDSEAAWLHHHKDELEGHTIRAPFIKGLAIPVLKSALRAAIELLEWDGNFEDVYHITHNILELDALSFATTFKAWKAYAKAAARHGYADPWAYYCDVTEKNFGGLWIAVAPHICWKSMPWQMVQPLSMRKEEIDAASKRESARLFRYFNSPKEASYLLHEGALRELASADPRWWNLEYVRTKAGKSFYSKVKKVCSGEWSSMGKYTFIAIDVFAILSALAFANGCKTVPFTMLKEDEIYSTVITDFNNEERAKAEEANKCYSALEEAGIGRNPTCQLDMQVCKLKDLRKEWPELAGLWCGHTAFVSPYSFQNLWLMDDYDGDKVLVILRKWAVNIIKRSHVEYDDKPQQYPGAAPDEYVAPNRENIRKMIFTANKADIGISSINVSKVIAHVGYDAYLLIVGAEAYNNGVDNAKYGGKKSKTAEAFDEAMQEVPNNSTRAWRKSSNNGNYIANVKKELASVRKDGSPKYVETLGTLDRVTSEIRETILDKFGEFDLSTQTTWFSEYKDQLPDFTQLCPTWKYDYVINKETGEIVSEKMVPAVNNIGGLIDVYTEIATDLTDDIHKMMSYGEQNKADSDGVSDAINTRYDEAIREWQERTIAIAEAKGYDIYDVVAWLVHKLFIWQSKKSKPTERQLDMFFGSKFAEIAVNATKGLRFIRQPDET